MNVYALYASLPEKARRALWCGISMGFTYWLVVIHHAFAENGHILPGT